MIELISKGGIIMIPLILVSIYALAIVFYKAYQFTTARIFDTGYVEPALAEIKRGDYQQAMRILNAAQGPVPKVMKVALDCIHNRDMTLRSREAEIGRVGSGELRYLEQHLRGLELVANVSPLLGLLGTVIGMIIAFAKLQAAGARVDPTMLAGGIWEALITTVAGLIIAVPALAAYYVIDGIIEKVRAMMKDTTIQVLALEDIFQRKELLHEKEELKRERMEEKMEVKQLEEEIRQRHLELALKQKELTDRQEELTERQQELKEAEIAARKAEEDLKAAASMARETPQNTGTLRLLNPRYN